MTKKTIERRVRREEEKMDAIKRLRQYMGKASFSSEMDRFSAIECIDEIERELNGLTQCRYCHGIGHTARDPDIGTDQECFVCEGLGTVPNSARLDAIIGLLIRRGYYPVAQEAAGDCAQLINGQWNMPRWGCNTLQRVIEDHGHELLNRAQGE